MNTLHRYLIGTAGAAIALLMLPGCERAHEDRDVFEEARAAIDTMVAHHPAVGGLTDREAIGVIALVNNGTIETSQLAEQRATSTEVRDLARWLLAEHDRMNTRARITADSLDLDPVTDSPPLVAQTREEVLQHLRQMPAGTEWDRMYLAGIGELHRAALERLREAHGTMRYLSVQDRVTEMQRLLESTTSRVQAFEAPAN
jgi:predicted outer membrane protein